MNYEEAQRALKLNILPVDLQHLGDCKGFGRLTQPACTPRCACCSKPLECPACRAVADAMLATLKKIEAERRKDAENKDNKGNKNRKDAE